MRDCEQRELLRLTTRCRDALRSVIDQTDRRAIADLLDYANAKLMKARVVPSVTGESEPLGGIDTTSLLKRV